MSEKVFSQIYLLEKQKLFNSLKYETSLGNNYFFKFKISCYDCWWGSKYSPYALRHFDFIFWTLDQEVIIIIISQC